MEWNGMEELMEKIFTNFDFQMYTEIAFGKDTERRVGELIQKYGGTKVLFVYGGGSIKKSGLYDRIVESLKAAGIAWVELAGVRANPRRSFVEEGIRVAKEAGADFYLGVGGGSAIDTAKAIALAAANEGEYWPFYNGVMPKAMAPVGAINTIAAAGSETSDSSVLVDDIESGFKYGMGWPVCRPVFAIMNPELTYTLPPEQTAAGAADIFAHVFMRYFTNYASYLGDQYCEATFRTVVKYAPLALADPTGYEARAELMLAGSFAHNEFTGIGRLAESRGGEHGLERQLSGYYDTTHGAGLAVVMPALLKYVLRVSSSVQKARIARFAVSVFGVDADMENPEDVAREGIARFELWLQALNMPTTLKALGIPEGEIAAAAERTISDNGGLINGWLGFGPEAIRKIFALASGWKR
jgi:alcohol dehydrogenase YqhD (iron-dependent ADH family)